jgi:hypothetical protein
MAEDEKKFTQADVDRIVSDRLKREKETHGDNEALKAENATLKESLASEKALRTGLEAKVALRDAADLKAKIAAEEKLPQGLIPLITGETEDEIRSKMKIMVASIGPGPAIGAETTPATPAPTRFTRAQIDQMAPEDIEKNWATIEKQIADGSLNR